MIDRCLAALVLLLALALSVSPALAADPPDPAVVEVQLNEWQRRVERMGREVGALRLSQGVIQRLNGEALKIQADVEALRDQVGGLAEEQRTLLGALGAKPADGQAEAADVAAQRKQLEAGVAELDGWLKRGAVIVARAEQVLNDLSTKRVEMLARDLVSTRPMPIDPRNWVRAAEELDYLLQLARLSVGVWFDRLAAGEAAVGAGFAGLAGLAAAGFLVGGFAATLARRRLARRGLVWGVGDPPPSKSGRILLAGLEVVLRLLPWVLGLGLGWRALPHEDLLPNAIVMAIASGIIYALATAISVAIAIRIVLAPRRPAWRLARLRDDAAVAIARSLVPLIVAAAVDNGVVRAAASFENVEAFIGLWALVGTAAIFLAARRVVRTMKAHGFHGARGWRTAALSILAVAVLAALGGFAALAQYLALGVAGTMLVLAAVAVANRLIREGLPRLLDPAGAAGSVLQRALSLPAEGLRLIEFWGGLLLDVAVIVGALVGLLLVWGATIDDVLVIWTRLIDGVRIGSYTFSLADFLLAIAVFVGVLVATRYGQRILDQRVFPRATLDAGVKHSLRSGIGYLGLVIATGLAVTTLGLSLSSLAFVVGALSVGIGFGLQNIVNNFVSGLILLIERPIKQGDRIVVGGNEGVVVRINVRATEIETFDRSSLLVPNSELLQSQVLNWTLRDPDARMRVVLRLPAPPFDAASGRDLIVACVRVQPELAREPAPLVLLRDFDATGYSFEVQAAVRDVALLDGAASDLRFAVDAAIQARAKRPAGG